MKALSILQFLANRAKEPSTWSALCALAFITGNQLPSYVPEVASQLFGGLAGALGVFLAERKVS